MVCFFDMDRLGMTQEEFYRKMKFFFRENFLKAGYSRLLQGYRGLRCQYLQAASVLELGLRKTPYIWIHQFDSVALEFLMERSTRDMLPEIVCHEGVNRLRQYDREHGSDYINTLRVYLDENMNVVHAAQKLFIHRSTLLYRLDKIRDIMETVLTDADERLYISLSVRLLEREQENAKGSFPRERI